MRHRRQAGQHGVWTAHQENHDTGKEQVPGQEEEDGVGVPGGFRGRQPYRQQRTRSQDQASRGDETFGTALRRCKQTKHLLAHG
jgi:hypothetical protein